MHVSECGIFINGEIGASPDRLLSLKQYLLEIKTSSFNTTSPLQYLDKYQYIQCQIQIHCSGKDNTVLMSYHQESHSVNYFLVPFNAEFVYVAIACLQSISSSQPLKGSQTWDSSCPKLQLLWEKNSNKIPDFKSLQALRSWIGELVKTFFFTKSDPWLIHTTDPQKSSTVAFCFIIMHNRALILIAHLC